MALAKFHSFKDKDNKLISVGYYLDEKKGIEKYLKSWDSWKKFELVIYTPQEGIYHAAKKRSYFEEKNSVKNMFDLLWDDKREAIEREKQRKKEAVEVSWDNLANILTIVLIVMIMISLLVVCVMGSQRVSKMIKREIKRRKDEMLGNNWNEVDELERL